MLKQDRTILKWLLSTVGNQYYFLKYSLTISTPFLLNEHYKFGILIATVRYMTKKL